jgi:hypothetical protein
MGFFAFYQLGLKTGYFKYRSHAVEISGSDTPHPVLNLPEPEFLRDLIGPDGLSQLLAEADEIACGSVRIFGSKLLPLNLTPPGVLSHWTELAQGNQEVIEDIKFVWEPARFGWAFTLGRAYHLTQEERYSKAFWSNFEQFEQSNPVNMGPHWESAQEVALRLIAFTFAAQIFAESKHSTRDRRLKIAASIANHAARIPPTLIYARAQNNNHLLSEAAGLISASYALPNHPHARKWSKLGWRWFLHGLQTQIGEDGAYMQQSTNYHRLMLQLALWVHQISAEKPLPEGSRDTSLKPLLPKVRLAVKWLLALCDPPTGRVPNLGPNDGAYILPLTVRPFDDYRPVLQAASSAFLKKPAFTYEIWDEMSLWLGNAQPLRRQNHFLEQTDLSNLVESHSTLRTPNAWAYFRAAQFRDRPGHADQLHLDLWWLGLNVAQDAGTYLYNADSPWDNALTHTAVHNTVMVDNHQQMTPAGRFLYLDWAQSDVLKRARAKDGSWQRVTASHDGYRRLGVIHQRCVTAYQEDQWIIEDQLLTIPNAPQKDLHTARLQWLLPDWQWKMDEPNLTIQLQSPHGWIQLSIRCTFDSAQETPPPHISHQLVRAGELLHGTGKTSPTWGWVSPTYGIKLPALSFAVTVKEATSITFISKWNFP